MLHDSITERVLGAAMKVGVQADAGYRIDFLVENCVIVELNALDKLLRLHLAQVLTSS